MSNKKTVNEDDLLWLIAMAKQIKAPIPELHTASNTQLRKYFKKGTYKCCLDILGQEVHVTLCGSNKSVDLSIDYADNSVYKQSVGITLPHTYNIESEVNEMAIFYKEG